jgi:hypothetical protein
MSDRAAAHDDPANLLTQDNGHMPAGELGVRAHVTRGAWGQPQWIRHATLGLKWEVLEVTETWERPDDSPAGEGQPVLLSREVVSVHGPRPGRPGESGRFMIEICGYGHVDGWWITPLALPPGRGSRPVMSSELGRSQSRKVRPWEAGRSGMRQS